MDLPIITPPADSFKEKNVLKLDNYEQQYQALVSQCLGWRGFRPLSRLAYGLYLTHCGVFFHVYMTATGPSRVGVVETVVTYLGALCLSLALAAALWLLVEAPANNLCALALSTRRADNNERRKPDAVSDDQGQEPNTGTVIYSDK